MTDEVAELVLADNAAQTRALYNARAQAHAMLDVHVRYLNVLERSGRLNRALEFLPTDDELAERAAAGGGLVMPEFAVLLAYSKIWIYDELLASELPEDAFLSAELARLLPDRRPAPVRRPAAGPPAPPRDHRDLRDERDGQPRRQHVRVPPGRGGRPPRPAHRPRAHRQPGRSSGWRSCRPRSSRWPTSRRRLRSGSCSRCGRWPSARAAGCSGTAASRWTSAARSSTSGRPSRCWPTRYRGCSPARTKRTRHSAARSHRFTADGVPEALAARVAALPALFSALDVIDVASATGRDLAAGGRGLLRPRSAPAARLAARAHPAAAPRRPVAGAGPCRAPRRPLRRPRLADRRGAAGRRRRRRTATS